MQNLGAASWTVPRHLNAQPFLRGNTPRTSRRTIFIVRLDRWIVSTIRGE
jgi:hypothetical protein